MCNPRQKGLILEKVLYSIEVGHMFSMQKDPGSIPLSPFNGFVITDGELLWPTALESQLD